MKIAIGQLNFVVGDFSSNREKMLGDVQRAHQSGCDLVIFSELAVCGYPPLDLLEKRAFVEECIAAVRELAREAPEGIGIILGAPEFNTHEEGKLLFNSAYFLYEGEIRQTFQKSLLPTYDIFDEYRYFEPNTDFHILEFKGQKIAVTVCEDLWDEQPMEQDFSRSRLYTTHPMEELIKLDPDFVVNISASPFTAGRQMIKQSIFTSKAEKYNIPVLMVNQTGANTELIFDGGSLVVDSTGQVRKRMAYFREDYYDFELDELRNPTEEVFGQPDRIASMHEGLVCGIRDYFEKSGFRKATLGLSGGIDSAVTLALAAEALKPEDIHVLLMPSQYSSGHSVSDSELLAQKLGISYDIISIKELFDLFRVQLKPVFGDLPEDLAEENIQSRIRGTLLMALSNKKGHILLNTSNKSETAVGYGTLYGDMAGGLSVLGDVYKVDVYALARYINREEEIIPEDIITKPPSAELRPDQKDSDSLPEYDMLDTILELYIEKQYALVDIIKLGYDEKLATRIIRLVNQNEYKRYQTPPILRISSKAFGVGRRIPIVGKY